MAGKVSLQMEFLTDQNKKVRLSIPNPKQPVDNQAVDNVMNLIVQKNIFAFPQGAIVKKMGANLVQSASNSIS